MSICHDGSGWVRLKVCRAASISVGLGAKALKACCCGMVQEFQAVGVVAWRMNWVWPNYMMEKGMVVPSKEPIAMALAIVVAAAVSDCHCRN